MAATFLASSDDSFVLSTASDIAADFKATSISTWLITGFNLGYMISLPIVSHGKNFRHQLYLVLEHLLTSS